MKTNIIGIIVLMLTMVSLFSGCFDLSNNTYLKPSEALSGSYNVGDNVTVKGFCKAVYGTGGGVGACDAFVSLCDSINEIEPALWLTLLCDFPEKDEIYASQGKTIILTIQKTGPEEWEIMLLNREHI